MTKETPATCESVELYGPYILFQTLGSASRVAIADRPAASHAVSIAIDPSAIWTPPEATFLRVQSGPEQG
ncbi:MAG: hypothetical protein WBQ09_16865 [Terriglobales bacterium]